MFFWWLVVGLLVAEVVMLCLLLAPLPRVLHAACVHLIARLQKPLWIVAALMSWVMLDSTMEMRNHQKEAPPGELHGQLMFLNKKWRAERNFYLTAFTFTLLLLLVRLQWVAKGQLTLLEENDQLRALRRVNQEGPSSKPDTKKEK